MGGAILATGQTALHDGTRHSTAITGNDCARYGHVRLRPADTPGAKWNGVHCDRHAEFEKCRVHSGQATGRGELHVPRVPGIFAWLYSAPDQSGRNSRTAPDHAPQFALLSEVNEPGAR